jgi:ribose transport system substrate-binding protein
MKNCWYKILLLLACSTAAAWAADAYTIAVIPKGTTHEFWKSIHAGAEKAKLELAAQGITVNIIWKGPLKEDDREQQIQVVENFIATSMGSSSPHSTTKPSSLRSRPPRAAKSP